MSAHLSVILRTEHFRGDHAADVGIAHEVAEGETVSDLAERLLSRDVDWIEIRITRPVQKAKEKP